MVVVWWTGTLRGVFLKTGVPLPREAVVFHRIPSGLFLGLGFLLSKQIKHLKNKKDINKLTI